FSSRRRHTSFSRDWSSDVCSSDLDTFTYQASNGVSRSLVATVTITVNATNQPPVANDDSYTTDVDTPLTVSAPGVLANDTDPNRSEERRVGKRGRRRQATDPLKNA